MVKRQIARFLVRIMLQRLLHDQRPFNRLLGRAACLHFGRITEEDFRKDLDAFFAQLDAETCQHEIDLAAKFDALNRSGGYKADILSLNEDSSSDPHRAGYDFWGRRFGLFRRLGIRSDVMIIRAAEQIPPHAHSRVVSGFYVLAGQVAIRHYDRVQEFPTHVLVRKVMDTVLPQGGYTTNSEHHHNIHWLAGQAPASYLFRFTAADVPVRRFGSHVGTRIYVDPTVPAEASGLIPAPYISATAARNVRFLL